MKKMLKSFWQEDDALGTVEMVLLLAALVAVALVFREQLTGWVSRAVAAVFGNADTGIDG